VSFFKAGNLRLRVEGEQVISDDGQVYDVREAIAEIRWVAAFKYPPAHSYAVRGRGPDAPWQVLSIFVRHSVDSYLAYFRGYQRPNRYVNLDGRRFWVTSSGGPKGGVTMLNSGRFEDAEPPRRVDEGGQPILDWQGPPWSLNGSPWPLWFQPGPDGRHVYVPALDPYRGRRRTGEET
jgi:hypothetical protein